MKKDEYIDALSRTSDRNGHLLLALMDRCQATNLQEVTEAQARAFYEEIAHKTGENPAKH